MRSIIIKFLYHNIVKKISIAALLVSIALPLSVSAQSTGTIRGRVIDAMTGDPLIGVTVIIQKERIFATTNINGRYTLSNVPAGTHKVLYSMMGYARSVATINMNGGVKVYNISLSYKTQKTVVVKAKRISNTTASLLNKRKKAPIAQDAISSEQISKSPDSDAADAAKRIPGVTIVGKNVFVRGLGERYSSVMLAGSTLPSPDPDKRVVPLDIFPTSLLDNIVVKKAYMPDMSAEFGGGVVQINPKDYPEDFLLKLKIGTGYHTTTTFKTFHTYEGGKYDFFGVDDGTRKMPEGINDKNVSSNDYTNEQLQSIKDDFKNEYTPNETKAILPLGVSFSLGNSFDLGNNKNFGYLITGMFKESSKTTESDILRVQDNWDILKKYDVKQSEYKTSKGILLSLGYTTLQHKLRLTSFYTHKSKDNTSILEGFNDDRQESNDGITDNDGNKRYRLQYVETSLLFNQLYGEHRFANNVKADWTASFSWAKRYEPDRREVKLIDYSSTGDYELYRADDIFRYYQEHDDYVYEVAPALTIPFKQWSGLRSTMKLGAGYSYRERDSSGRRFSYNGTSPLLPGTTSEPIEDQVDSLPEITENSGFNNSYKGMLKIMHGFAQLDIPIVKDLRIVGGVRYEYTDATIEAFDDNLGKVTEIDTKPFEEHNWAPGVSLTYSLANTQNLRLAFSKTVARPDFREITPGKYVTLIDDEIMLGNPDLKQTDIYNFDLRYELFPKSDELLALSVFYKKMDSPIELLEKAGTSGTTNYIYENADEAHNAGVELEIRKGFGFIAKGLSNLSTMINIAYIYSRIKVPEADFGDTNYTNDDRPLQGQSPYVINAGLNYGLKGAGFDATLLFNINGRRIVRVGTTVGNQLYPETLVERGDVYEEPVAKLDFVIKQKIKALGGEIKFAAENLINPEIKETQRRQLAGTDEYKTFTLKKYRDGRSFKISYTQKF